jgi:type VI secretion system secreted protein Hcp
MGNLFLQLDDIMGESTDDHHPGEIEIRGWKWSMTYPKPLGLPTNMKAAAAAATPSASTDTEDKFNVHNIVVEKYFDAASATLAQYCCKGKQIKSGTLTCRKNYGDDQLEYLVVDLKKIKIRNLSWPGGEGGEHGGGLVNETVELVFGEFDVTYMQQANDDPGLGIALGSSTFCWDVTDNKEIGGSPSGPLKIVRKQFTPTRHYPVPTPDE